MATAPPLTEGSHRTAEARPEPPKTKPTPSPARLEANRLNALKSTGPKTAEGKARSRQNALKHGMSGAGVVVHAEDKEALNQRLEDWTADLRPRDSVEAWLVGRAALASVRLDRCARQERARLDDRVASFVAEWKQRDRQATEQLGAGLDASPVATLATLRGRAAGCDWLAGQLDALIDSLQAAGRLSRAELTRLVRLLGQAGPPSAGSQTPVSAVWAAGLALERQVDPDEVDRVLGTSTRGRPQPERLAEARRALPDRAEARTRLQQVLMAERDAWRRRAEELRPTVDGPLEQAAADWRLFDESATAEKMARYEKANALEVHRCLGLLGRKRRDDARRARDRAARQPRTPQRVGREALAAQPTEPPRHQETGDRTAQPARFPMPQPLKERVASTPGLTRVEETPRLQADAPRSGDGQPQNEARSDDRQPLTPQASSVCDVSPGGGSALHPGPLPAS